MKRVFKMTTLLVLLFFILTANAFCQDLAAVIASGNSMKAKELLDKGANPNIKMANGEWALVWCLMHMDSGRMLTIKPLVEHGADVNALAKGGETALMYATYTRVVELVKLLVEKGADINKKTQYGTPPLLTAANMPGKNGDELFKYLIEKGADVNFASSKDETAIFLAASGGYLNRVKTLVEKGANINYKRSKNWGGDTPFLYSIINNCEPIKGCTQIEMVKYFIEHGADINAKPNSGETAVYAAVNNNQKEILALLIANKANVNIKTKTGESPLAAAKRNESKVIIEMLKKAGAK
jgi:ankyrin repeat protein